VHVSTDHQSLVSYFNHKNLSGRKARRTWTRTWKGYRCSFISVISLFMSSTVAPRTLFLATGTSGTSCAT
jgi:hypothetical protein